MGVLKERIDFIEEILNYPSNPAEMLIIEILEKYHGILIMRYPR